ncbi:MAG TPA: hypothetical protein VGH99_15850 [Pseudonocardia sp.]|jgi:hypothetical protein
MKRTLMRRTSVAVAAAALATGASSLFGGVALATGHGHHNHEGGDGGDGGKTNANCLVPIGVSAGVVGQGDDASQCNATGGAGADGGTGANY